MFVGVFAPLPTRVCALYSSTRGLCALVHRVRALSTCPQGSSHIGPLGSSLGICPQSSWSIVCHIGLAVWPAWLDVCLSLKLLTEWGCLLEHVDMDSMCPFVCIHTIVIYLQECNSGSGTTRCLALVFDIIWFDNGCYSQLVQVLILSSRV